VPNERIELPTTTLWWKWYINIFKVTTQGNPSHLLPTVIFVSDWKTTVQVMTTYSVTCHEFVRSPINICIE